MASMFDKNERQTAQMSKITNYCFTRSGTGYFIVIPMW